MKKRGIALIAITLGGMFACLLFVISKLILEANSLQLRPWVITVAYAIFLLLIVSSIMMMCSIYITKLKKENDKQENDTGKSSNIIGLLFGSLLILTFLGYGVFRLVSGPSESVIERNGHKFVAVESDDYSVTYYEYKNFLWMGDKITP